MRLGKMLAVGALATISAAALSQDFAIHKMTVVNPEILLARRYRPAPPPQPQPPQAPAINFRGCVYYEHDDWGGKWRSIPGGTRRAYVGDLWNETISSFACNPACRAVAFADRDFKGDRVEFAGTRSVPGWNDKISSMIATCQHPF